MKEYKSNLPQITLQLRKGYALKAKIGCSADADEVFRKIWDVDSLPIYESFIALYLNRANNTTGWLKVSQGGTVGTVVDIKMILTAAINSLACSVIVAHNHPSGNTNPSDADIKLTTKLRDACKLLDITLLDSMILTEDSYKSFADEGLL